MAVTPEHKPHSDHLFHALQKLRRYGGNAVFGEQEANALVDRLDSLEEQFEVLREALDTIATKFDKYGNEGYPAAIARQALRKVSSPASRSSDG